MLKLFLYDRLLMQCSKLISSTRHLKRYNTYCMMFEYATCFVFPIDLLICATPKLDMNLNIYAFGWSSRLKLLIRSLRMPS